MNVSVSPRSRFFSPISDVNQLPGGDSYNLHAAVTLSDHFGAGMRHRGSKVNELGEQTVVVHRK